MTGQRVSDEQLAKIERDTNAIEWSTGPDWAFHMLENQRLLAADLRAAREENQQLRIPWAEVDDALSSLVVVAAEMCSCPDPAEAATTPVCVALTRLVELLWDRPLPASLGGGSSD